MIVLALSACTIMPQTAPRIPSDLATIGRLAERSSFEIEETPERSSTTPGPADDPSSDTLEEPGPATTKWTYGALAVGILGGVGTAAFGITGHVTERRLEKDYEEGLTLAQQEQLVDRGEIMNGLTIGSAIIGLLGLTTAAVLYGNDYRRCGPLSRKRRPCPDTP